MSKDQEQMLQEFDQLITTGNIDGVVPFIKKYKTGNLTTLRKYLNKARVYWADDHTVRDGNFLRLVRRGTDQQNNTIFLLAYALLNPADYSNRWDDHLRKTLDGQHFPLELLQQLDSKEIVHAVLNRRLQEYWLTYDYIEYRIFEEMGIAEHYPAFIAHTLSHGSIVFDMYCPSKTSSKMNAKDLTLFRMSDIRYLFEYNTNLHENAENWHSVISQMLARGELDRFWVLQKCIATQNQAWVTNLKKFFKDVFTKLNPTVDELLIFQDDLFALLSHEQSPVVNFAITTLKPIIHEAKFKLADYIDALSPVMMNVNFKTVIKAVMAQLTAILKNQPQMIEKIAPLIISSLILNDLNQQEKSAKLLLKYATEKYLNKTQLADIQQQLLAMQAVILHDTQQILTPFFPEKEVTKSITFSDLNYHYQPEAVDYFNAENRVELYQDWHDLLFAFGELLHRDEPLKFDIFMSSWLKIQHKIGYPDDICEPWHEFFVKRAKKLGSSASLSVLFIHHLENFHHLNEEMPPHFQFFYLQNRHLLSWEGVIHQFIKLDQAKSALPLLSLPTHRPSFIEPVVLVERLIAYQQKNMAIDLTDFAVALARTPRVNVEPAIALLDQIQDPLIVETLKFAFGLTALGETVPMQPIVEMIEHSEQYRLDRSAWQAVWRTVALTHYPHIQLNEQAEYDDVVHNHLTDKEKLFTEYYAVSPREQISYGLFDKTNDWLVFSLPDYQHIHQADIYRQSCYFLPKNNRLFLFRYVGIESLIVLARHLTPLNQAFNDRRMYGLFYLDEKKDYFYLISLLSKIGQPDYAVNAYTQCIIGACFFHSAKEVRLAVVDTAMALSSQFKLDPEILVQHISVLLKRKLVPFSRFLECIGLWASYERVYQVVLFDILEKLILALEINDLPNQFKKFLEQYYQLCVNLQCSPCAEVNTKLMQWVALSNGIKTIVNKIVKLAV